jgi:hypothetical protein
MEIATLVIAVVGVTLAALSIGWQASTFFLSGPRVRVALREGFQGPFGAMLGPPSLYAETGTESLVRMGYTEHVVGVEAVNRGRLPATVVLWSLRFGNGAAYQNPSDPSNPELPYRLEPETSAIWYAPVEHLRAFQEALVDQSESTATLRAQVSLASGREITSKNGLVIGPETRAPRSRMSRLRQRLPRAKSRSGGDR